jgi:hypothetical protein
MALATMTIKRYLIPPPLHSRIRMLAFDQLPKSIRDLMNESACDFPPVDVLNYFVRNGEAKTIANLKASEKRARYQRIQQLGY